MNVLIRIGVVSFGFFILTGCASNHMRGLGHGYEYVRVISGLPEERNDINAKSQSRTVQESAGTGAKTGVIGGAAFGLVCGPFFVICSPIFAGAGLVTGAAAGGVIGAAQTMSTVDRERLESTMSKLDEQRNYQEELLQHVTLHTGNHATVIDDAAALELSVQLEVIRFMAYRSKKVSLYMSAVSHADVTSTEDKPSRRYSRSYEYTSERYPVAAWTDSSDLLDREIQRGYTVIASKLIADLWD